MPDEKIFVLAVTSGLPEPPFRFLNDVVMGPFFLLTAFGPLTLYFGFLAWVNSRRRPVVLSGPSDRLALFCALAGLLFIGPLQLIVPIEALVDKGAFTWVMLLLLSLLVVLFFALSRRPRLMIYNVSSDGVSEKLTEAAKKFDPASSSSGPAVFLPRVGFGLLLDAFVPLNHASVTLFGRKPDPAEWRALEKELADVFTILPPGSRRVWKYFALLALMFAAGLTCLAFRYPEEIANGFLFFFNP